MTEPLADLIRSGVLIPVEVFGGGPDDPDWGYGLCDRFSTHANSGSDCNRALPFLLRPSDEATTREVIAALNEVLEDSDKIDEERQEWRFK